MTFTIAGFYFYRTTDGGTWFEVICACLWFITGVINCWLLYDMGLFDGKIEILDIVNEVVKEASEEVRQKIKELEESEGEDES